MSLTENKRIAILAQQIIDGSIGIIEGCRRMTSLKIKQKVRDDEDFLTIRGIDSQTDEFPIGDVRKHYHKASIEKLDKELSEYLEQTKPVIFEACKSKYGS